MKGMCSLGVSSLELCSQLQTGDPKGLASRSRESHKIVYLTRKSSRTRKFEEFQTKSSSLSDDGQKITINDKHHLIGQ